jgi:DNA-binding NarL/FixJ family response regulator
MSDRVSIVIADDHPVFRQGLRQLIEAEPGFEIVGEASDGRHASDLIRKLKPAVAVLDISMPEQDGLSVVRTLRENRLPVEIVFLTMYRDESMFNSALDLDVKGYVLKDSAPSDIVSAIQAVCRGEHYTSPLLTSYLVKSSRAAPAVTTKPEYNRDISNLSPAERRILVMIAEYKTSKDIADELHISRRTVETHRTNICQKLGLHGNHALMKFALEHKSSSRDTSTK